METTRQIVTGLKDEDLEAQAEAIRQAQAFQHAIRSGWARDFAARSRALGARATRADADLRRWSSAYARGNA
jgi:hypothetical protein